MKYIFRTLWLIGYIPVFIFMSVAFFITIFIYPLALSFYFVKTGDCENIPFAPDVIPIITDNAYRKLLKYICYTQNSNYYICSGE